MSSGGVPHPNMGAGVLEEDDEMELAGTAKMEVERDSLG